MWIFKDLQVCKIRENLTMSHPLQRHPHMHYSFRKHLQEMDLSIIANATFLRARNWIAFSSPDTQARRFFKLGSDKAHSVPGLPTTSFRRPLRDFSPQSRCHFSDLKILQNFIGGCLMAELVVGEECVWVWSTPLSLTLRVRVAHSWSRQCL